MTRETASAKTYDTVAKMLHWLIAAMIVLQFVLANLAEGAEESGSEFQQLVLLANHKSVGLTILTLAIVRLIWRFLHPPPAPLAMPAWQRWASNISHWSLYVLLILLPVSGWIMSSAAAISVSWFNLFQLPDLVGANEVLEEVFEDLHESFAKLLFILAAIHLLAALKHTFLDRDGAIRRISSTLSIALFVAVIAAGVLALT
jgi:cytochrome b561